MDNIAYITPQFAVTAALAPEDFAAAAAMGFRSVISNRPDNEELGQLTARAEVRAGVAVRSRVSSCPGSQGRAFSEMPSWRPWKRRSAPSRVPCWLTARLARARPSPGLLPVPAASRWTACWPPLRQAGFDLEALREELEAQASRKRWLGSALPALDCREAAKFAALHPAA